MPEHVQEIPLLTLTAVYPPESVLDVILGHEYFVVLSGFSECANDALERVFVLIHSPLWFRFLQCILYGWHGGANFQAQ